MSELSLDSKTFILIFMAIIWKEILIKSLIYIRHNKIPKSKNAVIKIMKYEIYSETGIYNNIKKYFSKAVEDGFLMPKLYRENKYATEAVNLFEKVYKIVQNNNYMEELKFLKDYSYNIDNFGTVSYNKETKCDCNSCKLIEVWDINLDLLFSDDNNKNNLVNTYLFLINK